MKLTDGATAVGISMALVIALLSPTQEMVMAR